MLLFLDRQPGGQPGSPSASVGSLAFSPLWMSMVRYGIHLGIFLQTGEAQSTPPPPLSTTGDGSASAPAAPPPPPRCRSAGPGQDYLGRAHKGWRPRDAIPCPCYVMSARDACCVLSVVVSPTPPAGASVRGRFARGPGWWSVRDHVRVGPMLPSYGV